MILWFLTFIFRSCGGIKPRVMNKNDILGTQNYKQSQGNTILAQKFAFFVNIYICG